MPRFIIWLIMLCILLLILAHCAYTAEADGWSELLANKPADAEVIFKHKVNESQPDLEDLEGLFQAESMQGNMNEAYQTIQKMVEVSRGQSIQGLFLLRLGVIADLTGRVSDFYNFSEKLSKDHMIDNYTATVLALILNKSYLRKNDFIEAAKILEESTRISKVSRIVGPVYIPSEYGLGYKTALEDNLTSVSHYHIDNVRADISGKINLADILPNDGNPGVAYVYLTMSSDSDKDAALDFFSKSVCRIWVNGNLAYSGALYKDGFVGVRNSRIIKLRKGKNLILVKAFRRDTIQIGFRDIESGGRLQGVEVLPFSEEDWGKEKLNRYSGRIFSKLYLPPFVENIENNDSLAAALWRNFYYVYTNNYGRGVSLNFELLKKYPESALIHYIAGEYYQAYFNLFESKARVITMCEKYMREAIKLKPDYILPKILLSKIYLVSKQESSAIKLLKEIAAENDELPWVYRTLAEQYSQKGWIALADDVIKKYYQLYPENAADVINFYLDVNEFFKAKEIFDKINNQIPLFIKYNLLMRFNMINEAKGVVNEWFKHYPHEKDRYYKAMLEIAQANTDHKDMEKYLFESLNKNPNNSSILEAIGSNMISTGDLEGGVEWLEKAHAASIIYKPSMPKLVKRIEADTTGEFELAKYDISLDQIDTNKVEKKNHERASFANLLNLKVVRVFPDLSSEMYEHRAVKIFGNEGISQLAELNVGQGEIIECRTISSDGVEYIPESSENMSLDKAISMYNVSIGSIIEYSKRQTTNSVPFFQDGINLESFNNPVIRSKYVLIIPEELLSRIDIKGFDPEVKINEKEKEVVLIWEEGLRNGVEPEEFMPKEQDVLESINVKIYSEELNKPKLISLTAPDLTTHELNNKAKELCRGKKSTKEKVAVIYEWIANNIQSNSDAKSARDAFLLKAGTAGSKAELMKVMLKAVGVVAYPLWSNIPYSVAGRLSEKDRVGSFAEFTLPVILRIENENIKKPDIWVRITDDLRENRPANIGTLNQGALALEKSPFGVRLSAVRDNDLEGVRVIPPEIDIADDGTAYVSGGVEFYGSAAASPRTVFYNSTHARQYSAQVAAQLFPGIIDVSYSIPTVNELEQGTKNWDEPLIIICKGKVLNYCTRRGSELYLSPFKSGEFVRNLIVKEPRTQPILIQMDIQSSQSKKYIIPDGFAYKNVPMDRVITSSFGMFILDYNVEGRELVVSGSILIPAQEIAPENSVLYNQFLSEVKDTVESGIIIKKLDMKFGEDILDEGIVAPEESGRFYVKELPGTLKAVVEKEGVE